MTHVLTVTFDQFNVSSVNKKYLKNKHLNVSVTIWNTPSYPESNINPLQEAEQWPPDLWMFLDTNWP